MWNAGLNVVARVAWAVSQAKNIISQTIEPLDLGLELNMLCLVGSKTALISQSTARLHFNTL